MEIFNLAEELEKERKKNKELEFKIEDLKEQVVYQDLWRKEYLNRIDKAIEIIEKHKDYKDEGLLVEETIELLNILKGE